MLPSALRSNFNAPHLYLRLATLHLDKLLVNVPFWYYDYLLKHLCKLCAMIFSILTLIYDPVHHLLLLGIYLSMDQTLLATNIWVGVKKHLVAAKRFCQ